MANSRNNLVVCAVVKKVLDPFDAHGKHFFPIYFDAVDSSEHTIGFYGMIYPQEQLGIGDRIYITIHNYKGQLSMKYLGKR